MTSVNISSEVAAPLPPLSGRWLPLLTTVRTMASALLKLPVPPIWRAPAGAARPALAAASEPRLPSNTVLAIGAHPDDVEIGCAGTLACHRARGDRVVILTLSAGERAGDPRERATESVAAAAALGAELVLGDLQDTRIAEGPATIELIQKTVQQISPSVVYVHTESDRHQDHRNVHRAAMVATRNVANVYCYQSPSATTAFRPTRFVPIVDQIDHKLDLLEMYASQTNTKAYLAPQLIEATAVYWGRFAHCTHVEPFEVVREQVEIR